MREPLIWPDFKSSWAQLLMEHLQDKRLHGFSYQREAYHLLQLDRLFESRGIDDIVLTENIVNEWLSSTLHRSPSTHRKRVIAIRQLVKFMQRQGLEAQLPPLPMSPRKELSSKARIFSVNEISRILNAADELPVIAHSPLRHRVVPELIRVLYGCGLRVGEACRLTVSDVDLNEGVLTIKQGKFNRDRFVPVTPGLLHRLNIYTQYLHNTDAEDCFFPSPRGQYVPRSIYDIFRELLASAGIEHGGRGQGPRLHELRHSFAVRKLESWYHSGEDLNAKLPLLATYLGHKSLVGTQAYLQLTQALHTDIADKLELMYGFVIPLESSL
jgi:integrase/recombinase XerD